MDVNVNRAWTRTRTKSGTDIDKDTTTETDKFNGHFIKKPKSGERSNTKNKCHSVQLTLEIDF